MKRMMKLHLVGAVAIATLLAGCDPKDPIYNTAHPDSGTITLTTDWSGIGEGLTVPDSYTVRVGDYSAPLSGTTNTIDNLFVPGSYRAYVYNTPDRILIDDVTASVGAATAPAGQSGPFVHSAPGWLFTSALDAAIEKDTDHTFTALMQQQVRELTLVIELTGGAAAHVKSVTGTLSGVAGTLNLDNGEHAAPSSAAMTFSQITSGTDAGKWSATVRLLGTAGGEQKLNARIVFTGGNPSAVTLDSDLSTELAAFNDDKRTPLTLGGRMVETPSGMGFEATIEGWEVVDPVEGDATLPVPARIGDFFYSDGSYSTELDPTKTVIGIVFQTDPARIGAAEKEALKEKGVTEPHGLVMALKNAGMNLPWGPYETDEGLTKCVSQEDNHNDISGYGNCAYIRENRGSFDDYPAFQAADKYNTTCPAPATSTGWYLPASGQCYDLLRNLGRLADWTVAEDYENDYYWYNQGDVPAKLNKWMEAIGAADKNLFASSYWFWSSSEFSGNLARGWDVLSDGIVLCCRRDKFYLNHVRAVLAF